MIRIIVKLLVVPDTSEDTAAAVGREHTIYTTRLGSQAKRELERVVHRMYQQLQKLKEFR